MTWWIFQNVVITTALIAVVATVCRVGRIGPVARHALWVLVLVKFVTPPLVEWPWAVPDPLGLARVDVASIEGSRPDLAEVEWSATPPNNDAVSDTDAEVPSLASQPSVTVSASAVDWSWLLGVWVTGSICLLGLEGVRLLRLARRRMVPAGEDSVLVARVAAHAARLGITPVQVRLVPGASAPVVWGAGRPCLLWPMELPPECTEACVDGLIVHELAHIKRGDHLVGWIELAAGVVWWWNPLFWYVRSALREQAELACDAWVISALPNGRRAYAESLLALSGATLRGASPSLAAVGIRATSRRVLERRLVMIMKGRTALRLPLGGLLSLALVAAATLPTWATPAQQVPPMPQAVATPAMSAAPATPSVIAPQAAPSRVPPAPPAARAVAAAPSALPQGAPPPLTPTRARAAQAVSSLAANRTVLRNRWLPASLPADGQELLQTYDKDLEAIRAEADQKAAARRETTIKALEALQDQYAKAGKLDEAVAIRDFLRAGGPNPSGTSELARLLRVPSKPPTGRR